MDLADLRREFESGQYASSPLSLRGRAVQEIETNLTRVERELDRAQQSLLLLNYRSVIHCDGILLNADRIQVDDLSPAVLEVRHAIVLIRQELRLAGEVEGWNAVVASVERVRSLASAATCCCRTVVIASRVILGGDYRPGDLFCGSEVRRKHESFLTAVSEGEDDPLRHSYSQLLLWQGQSATSIAYVLTVNRRICSVDSAYW
ncbi:hypothetical protein COY93_00410 [Candidatus Uhrbacteria bacterium CG_4_10_14_0_8_um_filter_58_22]|uniref:Uncharacterized protein n=1 Tax=Candidatus Uhrbacteria bacterium CG_4_10_14_0_8_um_filter_58_22 TaxID=1975029 RepID=A0A2M7QC35_9BACT|nr:MAG: hypothetical protein AUJ19_04925 [Parcubacteria group bacterium CG1_02_58_44]PIY63341.1 MAG: hypothetical protein COY93_00410 [Candidatus Uhrbacteria bacterium CG_4_10_14_0_8_um_filter_58_22]